MPRESRPGPVTRGTDPAVHLRSTSAEQSRKRSIGDVTATHYVEGSYERRIRVASEVATWGVAFIQVGSAALPTTDAVSRIGLLFTSALLGVFAIVWFHLLPPRAFGRLRFTIGTSITSIVAGVLLVLTGGGDSRYFAFFLLPILATTFGMRLAGTLAVGAISVATYFTILVSDGVLLGLDGTAMSTDLV